MKEDRKQETQPDGKRRFCDACGSLLPEGSQICMRCGRRVRSETGASVHIDARIPKVSRSTMSHSKIGRKLWNARRAIKRTLFVALGVMLAAVIFSASFWGKDYLHYRKAINLYEEGNYAAAAEQLSPLAKDNFLDANDRYQQAQYQQGMYLFEEEQYIQALTAFSQVGEYKDSDEYLEQSKQNIYQQAVQDYHNKNYEEATSLLTILGDYSDSQKVLESVESDQTNEESILVEDKQQVAEQWSVAYSQALSDLLTWSGQQEINKEPLLKLFSPENPLWAQLGNWESIWNGKDHLTAHLNDIKVSVDDALPLEDETQHQISVHVKMELSADYGNERTAFQQTAEDTYKLGYTDVGWVCIDADSANLADILSTYAHIDVNSDAYLMELVLQGKERYYTYEELSQYEEEALSILRNGMYALSGRQFRKNTRVKEFFDTQEWYRPDSTDNSVVTSRMNDFQRKNLALVLRVEKDKGYR